MKAIQSGFSLVALSAFVLIVSRLLMMSFFPVVGDEAYYFYWGQHFAGGYYDLSPMIGWLENIFGRISLHPFWLRLPNLLVMFAVSFGMYEWMNRVVARSRALLIAALFFFSPIPFLAVLISPDVPLLFFSFFSVLLFYQEKPKSYFFSGALWGAAVLSKYFALFLLPAMVIWFLFQKRKKWIAVFWFVLGAFPFLYQHLDWNSKHCWANFVFNLVTRQKTIDGPLWMVVSLYFVYLIVLATPLLLGSFRTKDSLVLEEGFDKIAELNKLRRYLFLMWAIPILVFGITALMGKGQGLHWYLSYVPFFFLWIGLGLDQHLISKKLNQMMLLTGVLTVLGLAVSFAPRKVLLPYFKSHYTYDFNAATLTDEYLSQILPEIVGAATVFTDGYTQSAMLDHAFRRYTEKTGVVLPPVNIWGEGSRFGRVFDWTIEWSQLEGKKIVLITRGMPDLSIYQRYFLAIERKSFDLGSDSLKAQYFISPGIGFQARRYREDIVRPAIRRFYPVEELPFITEGCFL